jgi:uncharacterized membrane protein
MNTTRLEAFSDGVIAIVITIMVLELKIPEGSGADEWSALSPLVPVLLTYVLSFVFLGIYWNNHHHMLHAAERITAGAMWANLHLLFWLSLVPFATGWMGQNHLAAAPTAFYGVVLLGSAIAYGILQMLLIFQPENENLSAAVGRGVKAKISIGLYAAAIPLAFFSSWISVALYVAVALMWLIPDRQIEEKIEEDEKHTTRTETIESK